MDREVVERIFFGHLLQPGEQLYYVALGSAYTASFQEQVTNLKNWSKSTLKSLTPAKVLSTAGAIAGVALLGLLPDPLVEVLDARLDHQDAREKKTSGEQPEGEFTVKVNGSILALSSTRLMLVLVSWKKNPKSPWEATLQEVKSWTAEQLQRAPLRLEEKNTRWPSWFLHLGDDAPGGYYFGKYPGFPYNLEQAAAIAERIHQARQDTGCS